MKKRIPIHPPLVATFPVLSLYSANLALVPASDLWRPLALSILAALLAWGLLSAIFRNVRRAAALTSVLVACTFLYSKVVNPYLYQDSHVLQISEWIVGCLLLLFLIGRSWKIGDWQTPFFNVGSIALVLSSLGSITFGYFSEQKHLSDIRKQTESTPATSRSALPDIFYIILDGYGRQDQLRRIFGFDNSAFVGELEKRGFYVAKGSHSNYCQTELSLPSSLNIELVQDLLPKMGPGEIDRAPLDELVMDNGVSRHLRAHGYRTVSITSGFPAFRMSKSDIWFHGPMLTTLFEQALLQLTPFNFGDSFTGTMYVQRRNDLLGAFNALGDQAHKSAVPRFVYTHILMPHPPFVFKPDGTYVRYHKSFGYWDGSHYYEFGGTKAEYSQGYVDQVRYLNSRILPLIDEILKQGRPMPIILIQGDHGSKRELDQNVLEKTDVNECFSNLSAYYVPAEMRKQLYPSITPVNSFRLIFNTLFGEKLPLIPDKSWYSSNDYPYKMIEVTDRLIKTPE